MTSLRESLMELCLHYELNDTKMPMSDVAQLVRGLLETYPAEPTSAPITSVPDLLERMRERIQQTVNEGKAGGLALGGFVADFALAVDVADEGDTEPHLIYSHSSTYRAWSLLRWGADGLAAAGHVHRTFPIMMVRGDDDDD